eukprot:3759094-Pyramimonas_sp.AAC.1
MGAAASVQEGEDDALDTFIKPKQAVKAVTAAANGDLVKAGGIVGKAAGKAIVKDVVQDVAQDALTDFMVEAGLNLVAPPGTYFVAKQIYNAVSWAVQPTPQRAPPPRRAPPPDVYTAVGTTVRAGQRLRDRSQAAGNNRVITCTRGHRLAAIPAGSHWGAICDGCWSGIGTSQNRLHCASCSYDLCKECAIKRR